MDGFEEGMKAFESTGGMANRIAELSQKLIDDYKPGAVLDADNPARRQAEAHSLE